MKCFINIPNKSNAQYLNCNDKSIIAHRIKQIDPYVIQLYRITKVAGTADNEPWATGVLVEYRGDKYLLTAGHVFDGTDPGEVAFCIDSFVYPIQGKVYFTSMQHAVNKIGGLAFVRLTKDTISDIQHAYKFLPEDQMYAFLPAIDKPVYMLLGYPVSKSKKVWQKGKMLIQPLFFVTEAKLDISKFLRLGYHPSQNILLDFHRKKVQVVGFKTKATAPDPHGISGCGLWVVDNDVPYLVGLVHSYDTPESVMIATKIEIVAKVIDDTIYGTPNPSLVSTLSFQK